jgi:high-affinity Fe2+/Pb2+ permease
MLLLFSAGMMTYGVHEIEEYVVDAWYIWESSITRAWEVFQTPLVITDKYHPLHDKWSIWIWLKAFVGRNSNPNYLEPLMWLLVMGYGMSLLYIPATIWSTPTPTKFQPN